MLRQYVYEDTQTHAPNHVYGLFHAYIFKS
jgi:hypothetical protein